MSVFEGAVPSGNGPVDEPMRNLLFMNFTETQAVVEARGDTFQPGSFSFALVPHDALDPDPATPKDGYGIQYSQEPSSVIPYWNDGGNQVGGDESAGGHFGTAVADKTIFPTHSSVAAVADRNRDGKLDLFIGAHHKSSGPAGGYRSGQMNAIYLNIGNVTQTLVVHEVLNGVPNPTTTSLSIDVPQFAEISYDRRNYPAAFPSLGVNDFPTDLIDWEEYLPIFGIQGRCNCPNSYILPCHKPEKRFSATNAAVFTDVNNDNWPDLILTNKGFGASPFQGPLHNPGQGSWFKSYSFLDSDMIYINRGVREVEPGVYKWLGFWNRTWDIMEKVPTGAFETNAPMGIAVADYDMDGDMDFFLNDVSFEGQEMDDRFGVTTTTDISMGGVFFRNETIRVETGMEQTDISFVASGAGTAPAYVGGSMDLHGDFTVPMWFGWGATFGDFDMDGDEDLYCGSKPNLAPIDDGQGISNFYLDAIFPGQPEVDFASPPTAQEALWDRMFENTRAGQSLADFNDTGPGDYQMIDYNPSEAHTVLGQPGTAQFTNAYVEGNVIRRERTTNILAGDYDQDGYLDLVVIPGGSSQFPATSLQVFHGLGDPGQTNSRLVVKLDGGTSCANCTRIPVGAKLIMKAKLDGITNTTQFREFRIGGANGATTHSLPIEFGIGLHPTTTGPADDVFVKVVWPCGHKEVFFVPLTQGLVGVGTLTTTTLTHTPPAGGGPGSLSGWDVSEVGVSSPMDEFDGMNPIVVNAHLTSQGGTGLQPQGIAAAELSIRKAGATKYDPVAMDHVFKPGNDGTGPIVIPVGDYYFDVLPMRLPLDATTNVDGFDIPGATDFELRVRSWNRQLGSAEGTTENGAIALMEILPEESLMVLSLDDWASVSGPASSITNGISLPGATSSPGSISKPFLFPADTNWSQYYAVFQIEDTVVGEPYRLRVSCPAPNVNAVTNINFVGTGAAMTVSGLLELPPFATHKNIALVVANLSPLQADIPITGFWRAHGPQLCP